jgi:hypothetical protein
MEGGKKRKDREGKIEYGENRRENEKETNVIRMTYLIKMSLPF